MENKVTLQDTLKSQDTEEWLDLVFYRPIGYRWALFFRKLNITPNTVTVMSILLGVAAGILFYFNDLWINIVGMALLVWANTYDSADGQLARMTGNYSRLGRILDGAAGDFWFVSIYASICLRLTPEWGCWIWILAATAGFFHSKQAAMADYFRNFHLLFVKEKKRSELDDYKTLKKSAQSLRWKSDFIEKLFLCFYLPYTKGQEDWTPQLQRLRQAMREKFGEGDKSPDFKIILGDCSGINANVRDNTQEEFREAFRRASLPMMKYTNILSFNTRVIALFISLFIGCPWLYFVFELTILNILLIYLLFSYETICKRFTIRLRRDD